MLYGSIGGFAIGTTDDCVLSDILNGIYPLEKPYMYNTKYLVLKTKHGISAHRGPLLDFTEHCTQGNTSLPSIRLADARSYLKSTHEP